jgi:transposase
MNTTTIGLDIAKRFFQAHGMDIRGKTSVTRRLKRAEVLRFFAKLPATWGSSTVNPDGWSARRTPSTLKCYPCVRYELLPM